VTEDQQREALREEYGQVGDYIRTGTSVIWDAFKTYFTVIALMFAAYGYLAWGEGKLHGTPRGIVLTCISLAGAVVTGLAGVAILRIDAYLGELLRRGVVVEKLLSDSDGGVTSLLSRKWSNAPRLNASTMTLAVFWVFAVAWVVAGFVGWASI
jgi:hypothetical protein